MVCPRYPSWAIALHNLRKWSLKMLRKTKSSNVCWRYQFIAFRHCFSEKACERNKISHWFKANKLSLNLTKAKYSIFHPASKKKRFLRESLPYLKMDNIVIERENVTKFLAVLIEENLSWKQHINNVRTKISKSIGILCKFRGIVQQCLIK